MPAVGPAGLPHHPGRGVGAAERHTGMAGSAHQPGLGRRRVWTLKVPGLLSQAADHALRSRAGPGGRAQSRYRLADALRRRPRELGHRYPGYEGAAAERLLLSLDTGTKAPPIPGPRCC